MLGGRTGSITSGGATTAVMGGMVGNTPDSFYNNWILVMPDAATSADQDRVVTAWTGSSGTATFATRTDTTYTNETYELWPPDSFFLAEINAAIDRVLIKTRHPVRVALPTVDSQSEYYLHRLTWVRDVRDIDRVALRNSPNLIANSDFTAWPNGSALAPALWTLAGSGATIARNTDTFLSIPGYSLSITRATNNVTLTYNVGGPDTLLQDLEGEQVIFGCWVRTATATCARIRITDGATTTNSSYHTGGGTLEFLTTAAHTVSTSETALQFVLSVDTSDGTAVFSNPIAVIGSSIPTDLQEHGDASARELPTGFRKYQNAVLLDHTTSRGSQLVTYTAMPYTALSADSSSTDCPDNIVWTGVIADLCGMLRPGKDMARWDRLYQRWGSRYAMLATAHRQQPAPAPATPTVVTGA